MESPLPRRARISWTVNGETPYCALGWLVVFPNGSAYAVQQDVYDGILGLPAVFFPFDIEYFKAQGGEVLAWLDDESGRAVTTD